MVDTTAKTIFPVLPNHVAENLLNRLFFQPFPIRFRAIFWYPLPVFPLIFFFLRKSSSVRVVISTVAGTVDGFTGDDDDNRSRYTVGPRLTGMTPVAAVGPDSYYRRVIRHFLGNKTSNRRRNEFVGDRTANLYR